MVWYIVLPYNMYRLGITLSATTKQMTYKQIQQVAQNLTQKRIQKGFDAKHESGTYTDGYIDALQEMTIELKTMFIKKQKEIL